MTIHDNDDSFETAYLLCLALGKILLARVVTCEKAGDCGTAKMLLSEAGQVASLGRNLKTLIPGGGKQIVLKAGTLPSLAAHLASRPVQGDTP